MMLSLTKKLGGFLAVAALAVGLAGAAPAATLTWSVQPATVGPSPDADFVSPGAVFVENDASNIRKVRRNPWGKGSKNVYNSISFGYAEYNFKALQGAVSFVWGSPDLWNSVQFFRMGNLIDTIPGFTAGGKNIPLAHLLATNIGDGLGFDTARFVSSQAAFEHAFIRFTPVTSVPVPAAGLLLLTALGGVSLLRRRKLV